VLTRKLLEVVPEDQFAWKPHDKSMSLIRLQLAPVSDRKKTSRGSRNETER